MPSKEWIVILAIIAILVGGGVIYTKKERTDFFDTIANEVARQLEELRPDLSDEGRWKVARIVAAQAALESGWGSTPQYRQGFNFGNLTAGPYWKGPTLGGGDLEYDAQGNVKPIAQAWRQYGSLAEAVSDFFTLLSWSNYRAARDSLMRGDAAGYAANLRAGGYFTAPLAGYQASINSILEGRA